MCEYDNLAQIYDLWSTGDEAYISSHDFYFELAKDFDEPIVELGIGTGRIAIDLARLGKNIIGVDLSPEMLKICRQKAIFNNVEKNISFLQQDARFFILQRKANLIYFPFRSIGHLITMDEKRKAFENIFNQLAPSGLFVFDHYIFNERWAKDHDGVPKLMYSEPINKTNERLLIWDIYRFDYLHQLMNCLIAIEKIDPDGNVLTKKYTSLSFSWILPAQVTDLAKQAGFHIKALYGDFDKNQFDNSARNQIWVLMKD